MNRKLKKTLDQLRSELDVLSIENLQSTLGGEGAADCYFQCLSFITGKSVEEIQMEYAMYYRDRTGNSTWSDQTAYNIVGYASGVESTDIQWLMDNYHLSGGVAPVGSPDGSYYYDQSIALLNYGNGNGHAIILTGTTIDGGYHYIDPQVMATNPMAPEVSGVIFGNDPRLMGVYGGYSPQ